MKNKYSKHVDLILKEEKSLLNFLKAKFPMFNNSNFFFRDLQYGIRSFLEKKNIKVSYQEAEYLATEFGNHLEKAGLFERVNSQGWNVRIAEFVTTEPGDPF